jgi:hypothetical protein
MYNKGMTRGNTNTREPKMTVNQLLALQNATIAADEAVCLNCGDVGCDYCEQADPLEGEYDDERQDYPDWWYQPVINLGNLVV